MTTEATERERDTQATSATDPTTLSDHERAEAESEVWNAIHNGTLIPEIDNIGWRTRTALVNSIMESLLTPECRRALPKVLAAVDASLPKFKDLEGIDITGGIPAEEYIRRGRDGD